MPPRELKGWFVTGTLVVVPCGARKIWDVDPQRGPTLARDAYVGSPFKVNRAYAEQLGARWVILSAKYGFIDPDFIIPGPYNVTFKRKSSNPVIVEFLRTQIPALGLDRCEHVIGLGGRAYREIIEAAFRPYPMELIFPFAGLPLGKALQATKHATSSGDPMGTAPRKTTP